MGLRTMLTNKEKNRGSHAMVNVLCDKCGTAWTTTLGKICQVHESGNVFSTLCPMCREGKKIEDKNRATNRRFLNSQNDISDDTKETQAEFMAKVDVTAE